MRNEAYNMDCIEYMRSLPDNAFDIAVCDPPYGRGNDGNLVNGGRFGQRFEKYFKPHGGARNQDLPTSRRFGGGWFRRYDKPMEQTAGRTERYKIGGGGRKQKLHNGTLLLLRSSSMSFSASAAIR